MENPDTNWALAPATNHAPLSAQAPPALPGTTLPAGGKVVPTGSAPPKSYKRDSRYYGADYEDRLLGYKQGVKPHEAGMFDPTTNWAL